jgi:hypothetical protein
VPASRRHADPSSLLLPEDRWRQARDAFATDVDLPTEGAERLRALASEQRELLTRLAHERDTTAEAQLTESQLVIDGPEIVEEGRLRRLIEARLPELDLADMLIEVDSWTGFSDHLVPLSASRRRGTDMPALLYAVILAQATNLGLSGMARASEYSYQQLEWAWEQLCREDTLTATSASVVDYHHSLPLAQQWGAGRLSSTDGQRFAARGRGPSVSPLPDTFGHRRHGMQIYSWTSDQYSQYASKVVTATVRDATHTLDGILDNQTVLPIEEHTTDTHGYTEMIFGAYDLLGLLFAPRIRNLDRQRLYRYRAEHRNRRPIQKQNPSGTHCPVLGRTAPPRRIAAPRMGTSVVAACPTTGRFTSQPASASTARVRPARQDQLRARLARRPRTSRSDRKAAQQGRTAPRPTPRDRLRQRRPHAPASRGTTKRTGALPSIVVNAIIV